MTISPETAFDVSRRRFVNAVSFTIAVLLGCIAGFVIALQNVANDNVKLRARVGLLEAREPIQLPATDDMCVVWLMQADLMKAKQRVCASVVPVQHQK